MTIAFAPAGSRGFDCNQPLSRSQAMMFAEAGYSFCIRYLPRTSSLLNGNLTIVEIQSILAANLSLMAVQHCPLPNWKPTGLLGTQYGQYAGQYASEIGLPQGINLWLDLEEVAAESSDQDVIDYCNNWAVEVSGHGYIPGLYVGYHPGLSNDQLYFDLSIKHYWRAYNADNEISTRGYQLVQHPQQKLDNIAFDPNTTQIDKMGDSVIWLSPGK